MQSTFDIDHSIFRTYDIRGIVGRSLNPGTIYRIGAAIGERARQLGSAGSDAAHGTSVVVARDGRNSSDSLQQALIAGLLAVGCDVVNIGQAATPVLYFATHHLGIANGVVVTGSHNPAAYNGLKIMLGGNTLHSQGIRDLIPLTERQQPLPTAAGGQVRSVDVTNAYIERLVARIGDAPAVLQPAARLRRFKVVLDCGNGVAGALAPQVFRALGHHVIPLYCEVDGNFPNHHPDPTVLANLCDLIATVAQHNADVGLAFDGDGDRLGVVDNTGQLIYPDRQMMLFARDVLAATPASTIIYDVKCSHHLATEIAACGGTPLMWKTGHSLIKAKMQELGAPLAGEMSGHIFFADRWYGFDDALYSGARLLQILAALNLPPAQVFASLPATVSTPELRIALAEGQAPQLMQQVIKADHFPDMRNTTIDGLRVDGATAWGLVRASNTEPSLVLRFEADDAMALAVLQQRFRELLLRIDAQLVLPF